MALIFDKLLIQCSRVHSIMTNKEGAAYLFELYSEYRYGKRPAIKGAPQVDRLVRGNSSEKDSTKLLSFVTGEQYYRNKKRVQSEYLTGAVDIIDAENLEDATKIVEVKTSDNQDTFCKRIFTGADKNNIIQLQSYLSITGKQYGELAYCLTSYSEKVIAEQKEILFSKMCPDGIKSEKFLLKWAEIETKLRFEDIIPKDRVLLYKIERDEIMINEIHDRVKWCRDFLKNLELKHNSLIYVK